MEFPYVIKKVRSRSLTKNGKQTTIHRLMTKSGQLNLQLSHVPYYKYYRFTKDFANTLVSIRWRWVTLVVILTHMFFYLAFAGIWMLDAWFSGDLQETKVSEQCVSGAHCFTGYLLLSIETLTTTGYGYLFPTEKCRFAWFNLMLSTLVSIFLDGAFISVVFLKICKPMKKDGLAFFSKKCGICLRNGKLCLVFKINDYLNKHGIEPEVTIYFINTSDGMERNFSVEMQELQVTSSGMFLWPTDVVHEINETSPFWKWTASDFMNNRFEIFAILSGTSLVTNQYSTSQTSYLNDEILWGFRFKSCMEYNDKLQQYTINKQDVFKLVPCDTPLCSSSMLRTIQNELEAREHVESNG